MHQFLTKVRGRLFAPIGPNKQELLNKVLDDIERRDLTVKITIDVVEKNINNEQEKLYKAFILKAADHFGNDFRSMQEDLKHFWPYNAEQVVIPPSRWSSSQLTEFIDRASAHLAQFGFHF